MSGKGGSGDRNGNGKGGGRGGGRAASVVKAKERARRERREGVAGNDHDEDKNKQRPGAKSVVPEENIYGEGRLANAKLHSSRPAAKASADAVKSKSKAGTASSSPSSAAAPSVPGAQAQYGQGRLADIKSADADARGGGRQRAAAFAAKSAKEQGTFALPAAVTASPTGKSSGVDQHQIISASASKEHADLIIGETSMMSTESRFESKPADAVHMYESSLKSSESGPQIIRGEVGYYEDGQAVAGGGEQFQYSVTLDDADSHARNAQFPSGAEVDDFSRDAETAGGGSSSIPEFVHNAAVAHIVSPEEIEREEAEFLDIPDAYEYQQPEAVPFRNTRRGRAFIAAGVCVVIAAVVGAAVGATVGGNNGGGELAGITPTPEPTMAPTPIAWTQSVQEHLTLQIGPHVNTPGTPYNDALVWIADIDPMNLTTRDEFLVQRYLLAVLYYSTVQEGGNGWVHCGASDPPSTGDNTCQAVIDDSGERLTDGNNVVPFDSSRWLSGANECDWMGIYCAAGGGELLDIVLVENNIEGTLVPELYHLQTLQRILLRGNALFGTIPSEYGRMAALLGLSIDSNQLTGNIPPEIYNMELLQEFNVHNNSLSGNLPAPPTGSWPRIRYLNLGTNSFSGEIPREFSNLERLANLFLDQNDLAGPMPEEVCSLRSSGNLRALEVDCAEVDCSPECCTNCQPGGFE